MIRRLSAALLIAATFIAPVLAQSPPVLTRTSENPPAGAQPRASDCDALYYEFKRYLDKSQVTLELLEEPPSESGDQAPVTVLTLRAGRFTVTGPSQDGTESESFAPADEVSLESCDGALDGAAEDTANVLVLDPVPSEPVIGVLRRGFRWGFHDLEPRWSLGEPRDVQLEPIIDAQIADAGAFSPGKQGDTKPAGPPPDPLFDLFTERSDRLILGNENLIKANDRLIRLTYMIVALLTLTLILMCVGFLAGAHSRRRGTRNLLETLGEYSRGVAGHSKTFEEGAMRTMREFEARWSRIVARIESLIAVDDEPDGVTPAPRHASLGEPAPARTAPTPPASRPLEDRIPASMDADAVADEFNRLVASGGDLDQLSNVHRLMVFAAERVGSGASQRLLLRDLEIASSRQSPSFFVGRTRDGRFFALPGPDLVLLMTNPRTLRERLRGFFQIDIGNYHRLQLAKPCWLTVTDEGDLEVSEQGQITSPS